MKAHWIVLKTKEHLSCEIHSGFDRFQRQIMSLRGLMFIGFKP